MTTTDVPSRDATELETPSADLLTEEPAAPVAPAAPEAAAPSQTEKLSWWFPRRRSPYLEGATGKNRLVGIDAARGLALLGMVTAHIGVTTSGYTSFEGWLALSHGRSSILFAVVAGFSLGILSGRLTPHTGEKLVRTRLRILVKLKTRCRSFC